MARRKNPRNMQFYSGRGNEDRKSTKGRIIKKGSSVLTKLQYRTLYPKRQSNNRYRSDTPYGGVEKGSSPGGDGNSPMNHYTPVLDWGYNDEFWKAEYRNGGKVERIRRFNRGGRVQRSGRSRTINISGTPAQMAQQSLITKLDAPAREQTGQSVQYRSPGCSLGSGGFCNGSGLCAGLGCINECRVSSGQISNFGMEWGGGFGDQNPSTNWDLGISYENTGGMSSFNCNFGFTF